MDNVISMRAAVSSDSMVATAMKALGNDPVAKATSEAWKSAIDAAMSVGRMQGRFAIESDIRAMLATIRTSQAIRAEIAEQQALTGDADPTPVQDASVASADFAENAARKGIREMFAGLTERERAQLKGML